MNLDHQEKFHETYTQFESVDMEKCFEKKCFEFECSFDLYFEIII